MRIRLALERRRSAAYWRSSGAIYQRSRHSFAPGDRDYAATAKHALVHFSRNNKNDAHLTISGAAGESTAALARIPQGDRAAMQKVYRLTSAKLFGVCVRILGERTEAEDVLQEVYLTVWRKAATFDAGRASPMTWLIAIARNRCIDRLRTTQQSRRMEPIDAADNVMDPGASRLGSSLSKRTWQPSLPWPPRE